jgi:hypothetical protein
MGDALRGTARHRTPVASHRTPGISKALGAVFGIKRQERYRSIG